MTSRVIMSNPGPFAVLRDTSIAFVLCLISFVNIFLYMAMCLSFIINDRTYSM